MGDNDTPWPEENFPDIPHMIRSIQRIKGGEGCFGELAEWCDPASCCWYELCSKVSAENYRAPQGDPLKKRR